jgi:hypothetical protein
VPHGPRPWHSSDYTTNITSSSSSNNTSSNNEFLILTLPCPLGDSRWSIYVMMVVVVHHRPGNRPTPAWTLATITTHTISNNRNSSNPWLPVACQERRSTRCCNFLTSRREHHRLRHLAPSWIVCISGHRRYLIPTMIPSRHNSMSACHWNGSSRRSSINIGSNHNNNIIIIHCNNTDQLSVMLLSLLHGCHHRHCPNVPLPSTTYSITITW